MMNKKWLRHKGNTLLITGVCLLIIVTSYSIVMYLVSNQNVTAQDIQDSLYLSNTATYKYIDKKLLGDDGEYLIIKDVDNALQIFKDKLKHNMKLDNTFKPITVKTIEGKISIKEFIIYNVQGNLVEIYALSTNGMLNKTIKDLSKETIVTPNGYKVKATTVHTTISFNVKGMNGEIDEQEVTVDTDIVNFKD